MRLFFLELMIAFRYLKAKKRETFISIISVLSLLGITIGVAALVVVMSVMNGYRSELTKKLKGVNSDVIITGQDYKLQEYKDVIKKIKKDKSLKKIIPAINEQSLLIFDNNALGVMIKGLRSQDMSSYHFLKSNYRKITKPNGVIVGNILARSMNISIGDTIRLVSPKIKESTFGPKPKIEEFYVEDVFRSGLSEYDGAYIIMKMEASQKLFEMTDSISRIEIFLNKDLDAQSISTALVRLLNFQYRVMSWQSMNQSIFNALKTERVVMFIILAFIIIVAAFNIISSLVMLVMDKSREIAILKTIGFSSGSVMRIFLVIGMTLGVFGTVFGVTAGITFAYHINDIKEFLSSITNTNLFDPIVYYLDILPSQTDMNDVKNISFLSLGLAFLSTIYPAYKAGNLSPVQGLKND